MSPITLRAMRDILAGKMMQMRSYLCVCAFCNLVNQNDLFTAGLDTLTVALVLLTQFPSLTHWDWLITSMNMTIMGKMTTRMANLRTICL